MIFAQTSGICWCEGCFKLHMLCSQHWGSVCWVIKPNQRTSLSWGTCFGQREESRCFTSAWVSFWWAHIWWDIGERERQNGLYPVERDRFEETKVMINGLMWVACLPPGAMVMCEPELLTRVMYGFIALPQLWSMLMSLDHVSTKDLEEIQCLGWHLRSC